MSQSATTMSTSDGRQYHIGCKLGDLAETIILVGDPGRVQKIASRFDKVRFENSHREYVTATGSYQGLEMTVMATGMGHDNTEMAIVEIGQITDKPNLIRCGTCGALDKTIAIGDVVISQAAMRFDSTTDFYAPKELPAIAHPDVTLALAMAAQKLKKAYHLGITASTSSFYGGQGRALPGFPIQNPNLPEQLAAIGVKNFEMETSALFILAHLRGLKAGAVCAAVGNRMSDVAGSPEEIAAAEANCIEITLEACCILAKMDNERQSSTSPIWLPNVDELK